MLSRYIDKPSNLRQINPCKMFVKKLPCSDTTDFFFLMNRKLLFPSPVLFTEQSPQIVIICKSTPTFGNTSTLQNVFGKQKFKNKDQQFIRKNRNERQEWWSIGIHFIIQRMTPFRLNLQRKQLDNVFQRENPNHCRCYFYCEWWIVRITFTEETKRSRKGEKHQK